MVTDRTVLSDSEGVVADKFFKSVRKNKTTREWIVTNLGEPIAIDEYQNAEFLTYHFAKKHYKKTSVLMVYHKGSVEEHSEFYHVMVCDNRVRRAWFDKVQNVQTQRYAKKSRHCRAS